MVFKSQLFVAGGQWITASDVDNFTAWNPTTSSLAFKKGFVGGGITALTSKDDKFIVSTENTVQAVKYTFTGDLTGFQLDMQDIEMTPGYGAKFWKSIARSEGDIYFVGADNVVRDLVRNATSGLMDTSSISENIKLTLSKYNMSTAAAIVWRNKLYVACRSDESGVNDIVLVFDAKYAAQNPSKEAWTKYRMYVSDWFVYSGALFMASSATPNVFRMFYDENGNEILTDDGSAIPWYYYTPQLDFEKPELKYRLKKVVSRGFITTGESVDYDFLFDYGTNATESVSLAGSDENYVFAPLSPALGEEVVGEEGATPDPFNGFVPFAFPFDVGTYDGYNIQCKISGQEASQRYKQTRLTLYVEPQDDVMTN